MDGFVIERVAPVVARASVAIAVMMDSMGWPYDSFDCLS